MLSRLHACIYLQDELVLRKVFFRNDKGKGLAAEHNNDEDGYSRDINGTYAGVAYHQEYLVLFSRAL